jgi:hypothetical protein
MRDARSTLGRVAETEQREDVEISAGSSATNGDAESKESGVDASAAGGPPAGHRDLVRSVLLAAALLGLGVPSSRLS